MDNKKVNSYVSYVLIIAAVVLSGIFGIVFFSLFVKTIESGFIFENSTLLLYAVGIILTLCTVLSVAFLFTKYQVISKTFILTTVLICLAAIGLYFLGKSGFFNKITSVEAFRAYIESFGTYAPVCFITVQFLQVVVLPIPSFITVAAGVLMFGAFYGAIYSCIGIIAGTYVAYFLGRWLGYKTVRWLVGEDTLKKWLTYTADKDKWVFTLMFFFPFFPDDLLCFIAGIVKLDTKFFIIMTLIARIASIFTSSYSLNNNLIPYDTWWGICIWILLFILTLWFVWLISKRLRKTQKNK